MKIKISDMMDRMECFPVEMEETDIGSARRIKEATLRKIRGESRKARFAGRICGSVAAALLLCVSTVAAGTVMKWEGFSRTEELSDAQKRELLKEAYKTCSLARDQEGNTIYYDENGAEILRLTAEEALKYEAELNEKRQEAVLESTTLADPADMPLMPLGVTEAAVDADGGFLDFLLGNGYMILLHPEGGDGWQLEKGDTVTVNLKADTDCNLTFGIFRDGSFLTEEVSLKMRTHSVTFCITEAGRYNFSVMYGSVGAGELTEGSMEISYCFSPRKKVYLNPDREKQRF